MTTRKRGFICGFAVAGLLVLAAVITMWMIDSDLDPPPGIRCFRRSIEVVIQPSVQDREVWKEGCEAAILVRDSWGEVKAPLIQVERPRRSGFLGAIRMERVWTVSFQYLDVGQTSIEFPVGDDLTHYHILIRQLEGEPGAKVAGDWHLWVIPHEEVSSASAPVLRLPEIGSLPLLSDLSASHVYLERMNAAERFRESLPENFGR